MGNRLKPENVTVTDDTGNIISDFDDELDKAKTEYTILEYRHKLEERARVRMLKDIRAGLERIYSADRIQILRLNMDFNWDKISEEQEEYTPDRDGKGQIPPRRIRARKIKDSLVISEKNTKEQFQGHGWNPEGPAGTEGNTSPGLQGKRRPVCEIQQKRGHKEPRGQQDQRGRSSATPMTIARYRSPSPSTACRTCRSSPSGDYDLDPTKEPVQTGLSPEELKKAENIVKKSINFDEGRGDQVAVENIMFDRSKYWDSLRAEFRKKEQIKKILLAALIGVIVAVRRLYPVPGDHQGAGAPEKGEGGGPGAGAAADAGGGPAGGGGGGHRRGALPGRTGAGWNCRKTP